MEKKKMTKEEKLKAENIQLKKALCICLNRPLIKRLDSAVERIKKGEYYTEEEFFNLTDEDLQEIKNENRKRIIKFY